MKKSAKIALSGVMTALSIVLLYLGGLIWVLSYTMPLICSLLMIMVMDLADKRTAILIFFSVSLISFFAIQDKETVMTYIFFFGYYPIIREKLNYLFRLIVFNLGIISSQLILFYIFGIPFDAFFGKWGIIVLLIAAELLFVMFDRLYNLMEILYEKKLKRLFLKYFK